ncbi:dnaJ homolog subfamily C member 10-like [Ylistrum balloti]|uniref:dnaJ homolog subfamily C member 10-like n=1 Tax=Ylistrum balloti TaxID=509963 RepID=UPI002905D251|nr:dnaJ homolog subfamily C member 10-like [Ylistrum balloti]
MKIISVDSPVLKSAQLLRSLIVLCFIWSVLVVVSAEDFYDLLGIPKSATTKEIRKAFKKLAITKHPDKNPDDPNAHDLFLKLTRAYEVLKDEDLRKKYDTHGEEGLKEDFHGGRQYESWKFYQEEFGIYDDDKEIITLSRSDFEQSVEGTEDIWFINYYSPHCGHCHDLAPHWRELARELEGVIRIGAVNCEDDWQLCRMQGIRSYPSLIMYPAREKYHGERMTGAMVKYALKQVKASVIDLWNGNFDSFTNNPENDRPWLITFCGDGGDCLTKSTCIKLAAMLEELVNVARLDCHNSEDICTRLGVEYGTIFYDSQEVVKGAGLKITSLFAQEIAHQVMSQLPDVSVLNKATFNEIKQRLKKGQKSVWLIHFVEGDADQDIEFRKLPGMLSDFKIGRVDCELMRTECNSVHVIKFPSFLVFKQTGGYEIYYGRMTAHDVAAFARDSAVVKVESLGKEDFHHHRVGPDSSDTWFVDFFAPWCPPCMRLLPEFRKAAKSYGEVVNFGTVDCTIHSDICRMYNINSYPTTILYNATVPIQYHGHHRADDLGEFIEDTLNPPVIILDFNNFDRLVRQKDEGVIWVIDFYASWCGPCQQLAPEWRRLAKMLKNTKNIFVAQVECQKEAALCRQENVNSYPSMRLYPADSQKGSGSFFTYNGWHRDAQSLRAWAFEFLPSKVETLRYYNFHQNVLSSSTPFIVDFYAPWCGHCQVFKPEFEKIAEALEGRVKAGKVNCDEDRNLCQQAGVSAYPTVRFYKGARKGMAQHMYGQDIDFLDANQIIRFINRKIPAQKTSHDEL